MQQQRRMYWWIAMLLLQFVPTFMIADNLTEALADPAENAQFEDLEFLVSHQDLHIDQENITAHVQGACYFVHSLKKEGSQWCVKVVRLAYCPRGHMTCSGCGQCHTEKCWYYVRPCKLWNKCLE